jgi:toxin-antitoxin system PIN domain toxin
MILCDVGVLVSAGMRDSPHHRVCREAVESLLAGSEGYAVSDLVLAAVVRISTNPKVWKTPATPASAFAFVKAVRGHRRATMIAPGSRHWRIFEDLVSSLAIRGSDTTDAYLAALAQEHGCEWWTTDKGFGRFSGLRWRNLIAA